MKISPPVLFVLGFCGFLYAVKGREDNSCRGITRGSHFVITFTGNYESNVNTVELSLLVVSFNENNSTSVNVSSTFEVNGEPYFSNFSIERRGHFRLKLPSELILGTTSERGNKVIEVSADSDVSVYGLNYAPFTTDAFLGIPTDHLGLNYVVMGFEETNLLLPSLFAVVGFEHNTQVLINLTATVTFEGHTYIPGSVLEFKINKNEVVQIVSDFGQEFVGGSIIKSDKRIAVFSGDLCSSSEDSFCDTLCEQIVPVRSWGTTHIYTATGSPSDSSIYSIYAYYEDTVVNVPGCDPVTLQPGEFLQKEITGSGVINTTQPASVVQILRTIKGAIVDPSIIQLPTRAQFGYKFGFSTPPTSGGDSQGFFNFLNIIVKANESGTVTLNNSALQSFGGLTIHAISGTSYEVYIIQVPKGEGVHFVEQMKTENTSPISVIVYGHENDESYGYSAGLSLPRDTRLFNIQPFFVREVGRERLTITLPCPESDVEDEEGSPIDCSFQTLNGEINVEGKIFLNGTGICFAPIFHEVGFVTVSVQDNTRNMSFRGSIYVASQYVLPPLLEVEQEGSPKNIINISSSNNINIIWDKMELSSRAEISVMIGTGITDKGNIKWSEQTIPTVTVTENTVLQPSQLLNANRAFHDPDNTSMAILSVQIVPRKGAVDTFSARRYSSGVLILVGKAKCDDWLRVLTSEHTTNVPPCPCTLNNARADIGNFKVDEVDLNYYRPGTHECYRSRNKGKSAQQCCYDAEGNIKSSDNDIGRGPAEAVARGGPWGTARHFWYDTLPWFACCKLGSNETCSDFYDHRQSSDCLGYNPPNPTRGTGDPHFTTLDGKEFTFNGAGEFLLVTSPVTNLTFQARVEVLRGTNASVYTAFVLKAEMSSSIQVHRSPLNETVVLIDGLPISLRQEDYVIREQDHEGLHLELNTDLSEVHIRQQTGVSLHIHITSEMMSFILQLPDMFQNQVQGLLGNFNGDPNDDFRLPNGSVLSPNLTLEEIHYEFGLSWILNASTSQFTYFPPNDFFTFYKPLFTPVLNFPDVNEVSDEVRELCGQSRQCLFDAISTGSTKFAEETLRDINTFDFIQNYSVKVITCGFPGKVFNGTVDGSVYLVGNRLSISCDEGFSLIGSAVLVCRENGSWSDVLPTCVSCPTPRAVPNATIIRTDHSVGSFLNILCMDGFTLSGPSMVECNKYGEWSTEFPNCLINCPVPPVIPNAVIEGLDYFEGSVLTFSCRDGYTLSGSPRVECNKYGEWSTEFPRCLVNCPVPSSLPNTAFEVSNYFSGSIMQFSCVYGYTLRGPSTIECQDTGMWSPEFPECVLVTCTEPESQSNTFIEGSDHFVGSSLQFSCAEGYNLVGSSQVKCNESGLWSPKLPECTREYLLGSWVVGIIIACGAATLIVLCLFFYWFVKKKYGRADAV